MKVGLLLVEEEEEEEDVCVERERKENTGVKDLEEEL